MIQRNLRGLFGLGWAAPALAALALASEGLADDAWPQWRGPTRDCRIEGEPWPTDLEGNRLTRLWRVEMGPSYSGPIVVGNRVFVTETRDQQREVVSCLDRQTGKVIWTAEWAGAMKVPFFAASNGSWIRSTPCCDGDSLYVAGMRDVLVCLDAATGAERWRVDFVKQLGTPLPAFGFVASPLVVGEHLYVQAGASLAKLDKRTGKILWRALEDDGGMYGSAFSSPTLATIGGREQLVVQTRTTLAGVDPADGRVLWQREIPAFRGMNILTPTVIGDSVFTSSYGGKSILLKVGKDTDVQDGWVNKAQAYMSSPVVINNYLYVHLRNRRFTCIDARTGEEKWTTKPFGKYWSMVAQGDRILALDERGELLLIRANPEKFELISSRKISSEETWAHLALVGDELFIRELGAMSVYRWTQQAGPQTAAR